MLAWGRLFILLILVMAGCARVWGEIAPAEQWAEPSEIELTLLTDAAPEAVIPDTVKERVAARIDWTTMLRQHRINLNDTLVNYPGFLRAAVNTYRWIDRTFNSTDTTYVRGTGRRGKVRLMSDNWLDASYFHPTNQPKLTMASDLYANIGVQANYSILSLSYSVDFASLLGRKTAHHKKWGLSVTWARIMLDAFFWDNSGGTFIRQFDKSDFTHPLHNEFKGASFKAYGVSALYFFNYKRFSYGAAYNLSKYQVKSAGTWAVGMIGTFYNAMFDFTQLPPEVTEHNPYPFDQFRLHYNSVMAYGGYSYNAVCGRHILFNFLLLPAVGTTFSFDNSTTGRKTLLSLGFKSGMAVSYCMGDYFVGANAKFDGNLFRTSQVAYLSSVGGFQLSVGRRF